MADTKTSLEAAAAALDGTELIRGVQAGANVKLTVSQIVTKVLQGTAGPITSPAYILAAGGIITDATTARTLSAGDNGKVLYFTNAAAITLTLAASLGVGFACTVVQGAAGQVTFAAGGQTMTIAGGLTKTASVGSMASVLSPAANVFLIAGTLA